MKKVKAKLATASDPAYTAKFLTASGRSLQAAAKAVANNDNDKSYNLIRAALKNLKSSLAFMDGGTAEPKVVRHLSKAIDLVGK